MKTYDTIIIGAGQAGLASGYYLKKEQADFLILEKDEVGGSWNEYYDSLTLFTPAEYSALPGMKFPAEAGHYPTRAEMAAYLKDYAAKFELPIETGVTVRSVQKVDGEFILETSRGEYRAKSVVVCSGPFNESYIPSIPGKELYKGKILHTHEYKNAEPLKNKKVIVVGAGASAVQIAVELAEVADVMLALRHKPKFWPRTILGKDITFWSRYTVDLFRGKKEGSIVIDTPEGKYKRALKENRPPQKAMFKAFYEDGVVWQDLPAQAGGAKEPVDVVIFGTGYRPLFTFLEPFDVLENGKLQQKSGKSLNTPGLFFLGQPNMRNYASATVRGAGRDGRIVVQKIIHFLGAKK